MRRVAALTRREPVLAIAWLLALLTTLLVPPDAAYLDYVDFRTLGLLFCLMAVMAGLQGLGVFRWAGRRLLSRTATTRQLEAALVFFPFFFSMAATNDVALITFVPFALEVLAQAGEERRIVPVVALQTVAANLGSMATPIGNPQNLYLYAHFQIPLPDFFAVTLPLALASGLLLALCLRLLPSRPLSLEGRLEEVARPGGGLLRLYLLLFLLCLCGVARLCPVWALVPAVLLCVLAADRRTLRRVDYALLLTFAGFFLFVGNLSRVPLFHDVFQRLLYHHELVCAAAVSQVISNVPAALLLSGFTDDAAALLAGTNLGGLGTLIASMASLISYKLLSRARPALREKYFLWFTAANIGFLAVLLPLCLLFF